MAVGKPIFFIMSEDNQDESLPSDVSMGVGNMCLDGNPEANLKYDSNGGSSDKKDKQKGKKINNLWVF